MSHVDEGALHAYLDGALDEYPAGEARRLREHLERCPDCAERLEEERRIRQDASTILGLAAPDVEVPSLEELKAYVKATRPTVRRHSVRLYRLGWAASVILAVGVGWMARGGRLDEAMAPTSNELVAPTDSPDRMPARVSSATADASEADQVQAPSRAGDPLDGVTTDEVVASTGRLEEQTAAGGVAAERDQLLKIDDERDVIPEGRGLENAVTAENPANADALRNVASGDAPEEVAAGRENLDDSLVEREAFRQAGGVGGLMTTLTDEEFRARTDSIEVTDPAIATPNEPAREEDEAGRRAAEPVTTRIRVARAVAPSAVSEFAGAPARSTEEDMVGAMAVPGISVLSYANLEEGTTPKGVHVVQAFENGDILDVYHLPEGVEPSVLPPLEGRNEVRAQREGGWIVLRAFRPEGTLRELLARLDPEG